MNDKADSIRRYDDALLRREPVIRVARILAAAILGVFLASALILAPTGFFQDRMALFAAPLYALLFVYWLLDANLRHIASINLYRNE